MFNLIFKIMKRKYLFLSALVIGFVMASCANNAEDNETESVQAEPEVEEIVSVETDTDVLKDAMDETYSKVKDIQKDVIEEATRVQNEAIEEATRIQNEAIEEAARMQQEAMENAMKMQQEAMESFSIY
jgi:hypothetical protein